MIALVSQSQGGAMAAPFPLTVRVMNAIYVYAAYLAKAAYPVNLSVFYPHPGVAISWGAVILAAVVLAAMSVAAVVFARRYPFLFFGWFWYLGTLVPMIGLIQIGTQQMADRYTYFPLIGIFLAVAWLLPQLVPAGFFRQRVLPISAAGVLTLYSAIAFFQLSYWHDSVTLLRHSQSCTRDNSVIHEFLAAALVGENSPEEAVAEYQAAIHLAAPYPPLHSGLATAYEMLGRKDEALEQFRAAESLDPQLIEAQNGLARILIEQGQYDEARRHAERALQLDPNNAQTYATLAALSVRTGDFSKALSYAQQGLELNSLVYACDLAVAQALRGLGRFDEATERLQRLAQLVPDDPAVRQELALTLAQKRGASGK